MSKCWINYSLLTQHLLRAASYTRAQGVTLFKGEVHALMSSKGLIAALITFMPLIRLLYVVCGNKGFYRFDWNNNDITEMSNGVWNRDFAQGVILARNGSGSRYHQLRLWLATKLHAVNGKRWHHYSCACISGFVWSNLFRSLMNNARSSPLICWFSETNPICVRADGDQNSLLCQIKRHDALKAFMRNKHDITSHQPWQILNITLPEKHFKNNQCV